MTKKTTLSPLTLLLGLVLLAALAGSLSLAQPASALPVIDDFESDLPNTWFSYGDFGSGTAVNTAIVATDTVPGLAPNNVLEIDYNSAGWGAGTGNDLGGQDWSQYDGFSFWFSGAASGGVFRVLLSDNPNPDVTGDSAERFAYEFSDNSDGWQHVLIPWGAFFRDPGFQPPGAPDDGLTLTDVQAYALALPVGTTAKIYLDDVRLVKFQGIDDFENDLPETWFSFGDYGSGTAINTTIVATDTVPGLNHPNNVLEIDYTSAGWGAGTGHDLGGQDWSDYNGFGFWFWGSDSGETYRVIISDNPNPDETGDSAERFAYEFADDSSGWRTISIPWAAFFRDPGFQPPGAPDDGLTLTDVQAYALALPNGTRVANLDNVALFGDGMVATSVAFAQSEYSVEEGAEATLTVSLNAPADVDVTVDFAVTGGTAAVDDDYELLTSSPLTFAPGVTEQIISVATNDDGDEEEDETVIFTLSNPVGAELGVRAEATLTIVDNDQPTLSGKSVLIDDFELDELPAGEDADGNAVGFATWNAPAASAGIAVTNTMPAPVPDLPDPNQVLQLDFTIGSGQWAGYTNAFANEDVDTWVSQDWSGYEGISLWLYGNNTGGGLFVDISENRNPGSTTDDAERWSYGIPDDFEGWKFFTIPFSEFTRKEIGNGAPNDGLTLEEVWGYSVGGFGSVDMGSQSYYVDNVGLLVRTTVLEDFERDDLPVGEDADGNGIGFVTWNHPDAAVDLELTDAPPAAVPGSAEGNTVLAETLTVGSGQWAGYTYAFTNEAVDTWIQQDWSSYEGICLWLYGNNSGGDLLIEFSENRNPGSTSDDAERWSYTVIDDFEGWKFFMIPFSEFNRKEIGNGAPNDGLTLEEIWGYSIGAFGSVDMGTNTYYVDDVTLYGNVGDADKLLEIEFADIKYTVVEGESVDVTVALSKVATETVTVDYLSAESVAVPDRDFTPVAGTLIFEPDVIEATFSIGTFDNSKHDGDRRLMLNLTNPVNVELGFSTRASVTIEDNDPVDPTLIDDFEGWNPYSASGDVYLDVTELKDGDENSRPGQDMYEYVLTGEFDTAASFARSFSQPQDWRAYDGLSFWYYGSGSGERITVELQDNQAATTAQTPADEWVMVWSDEFDESAGTPPNPNVWTHEIGDGTLNDNPGWGNGEFQFYTDDPANASTDGGGNLIVSLQETAEDDTRQCWYGPCEYTSARLISSQKLDVEYGRIEARALVPPGGPGLWPAFWMLGTNIDEVGWPQSGEIDIMEYVSKFPDEVFGTIHGPGYSGGSGFGATLNIPEGVAANYHTFTVEWSPDEIHWFVDGINYLNASPADVAPNEWVYNQPFFLILNLAIGGNFGGDIAEDMTFPQNLAVDYVRVYQAADTAERFEASFVDNVAGWQQVEIPFAWFQRSADQPAGAPDDGLGLDDVSGYGFNLPDGVTGMFMLDQVRLEETIELPAWMGSIVQTTDDDPAIYGSTIAVDASASNYSGAASDAFLIVPLDDEVSYIGGSAYGGAFPLTGGQMAAMGHSLGAQSFTDHHTGVVAVAYSGMLDNNQSVSFGFETEVTSTAAGSVQHRLFTPQGIFYSNALNVSESVMIELPLLADTWVNSGDATENFNTYAALIARTTGVDNILLTFDRSEVPIGTSIVSAQLDVNATFQSGADGKQLSILNVMPFDSATVTFNDSPAVFNPGESIPVTLGPISFDATTQVAAWDAVMAQSLAQDMNGYLAISASGPFGRVVLDSLETYQADPATLTIVYLP